MWFMTYLKSLYHDIHLWLIFALITMPFYNITTDLSPKRQASDVGFFRMSFRTASISSAATPVASAASHAVGDVATRTRRISRKTWRALDPDFRKLCANVLFWLENGHFYWKINFDWLWFWIDFEGVHLLKQLYDSQTIQLFFGKVSDFESVAVASSSTSLRSPRLCAVPLGVSVSGVACGGDHTLLLADGQIFGVGDNSSGQLGLGVLMKQYETIWNICLIFFYHIICVSVYSVTCI